MAGAEKLHIPTSNGNVTRVTISSPAWKLPKPEHDHLRPGFGDDREMQSSNAIKLISLPKEILEMILEYVPQCDRVRQRLVSNEWKNIIDECSTFKIDYTKIPENLRDFILLQRLRAVEFSGLREDTKITFSHPLLVREITLGPWVSPENTKNILLSCVNVEIIRCFGTENSDTSFFGLDDFSYLKQLRNLKCIELGVLFFGPRTNTSVIPSFKAFIGNQDLVFPTLTHLRILYKMSATEWKDFLLCIKRHSKTLTKLYLYNQCICEYHVNETRNSEQVPSVSDYLKNVCLERIVVINGTQYKCECGGATIWSNLLHKQRQVEVLSTDLVPKNTAIDNFVKMNSTTLKVVKLLDVSLGTSACMDLSVFENCRNLQVLLLHFMSCAVIVMNVQKYPGEPGSVVNRYAESVGIQHLPKSLRKLGIYGCDISSSSLIEMSYNLRKLQTFYIGERNSPRRMDYGITPEVLFNLLHNLEDLQVISIDREFLHSKTSQNANYISTLYKIMQKSDDNALTRTALEMEIQSSIFQYASTDNMIVLNFRTSPNQRLEVLENLRPFFEESTQ